MKRSKKIIVLAAVLVVAIVATFAATTITEYQEQIQASEDEILAVTVDDVTSLSWSYETDDGSDSLSFTKNEDGVWHWDDDEDFPVSEEQIDSLLETFSSFTVSFIIEEVEDYSQYGLDDPTCTIEFATDSESYTVTLGNYSTLDEQRYVSIGDGNAYLVSTDPMESFELTIEDMIENDDALSYDSISAIEVSGEVEMSITYSEEEGLSVDEDDVYYTDDGLPLDTSNVTSYLSELRYIDLTDYVTYNATDEEIATYGLDDPELTVTVDYSVEDESDESGETYIDGTYVLYVSRSAEDKESYSAEEAIAMIEEEAAEEEEEEEEEDSSSDDSSSDDSSSDDAEEEDSYAAYVRVGDSQIIYGIDEETYVDLMAASYDDLRHAEPFTADFDTATSIEVTVDGVTYTLTAEVDEGDEDDEDDDEITWKYGDEEIDISSVESALEALTATEFTDEDPTNSQEISLTIYLDNEDFPTIDIELYTYDGTNCLAVVDGENFGFIARSLVVDLVEAVNEIVLN